MLVGCPQENCTVGTTGQCLLNHSPPSLCKNYQVSYEDSGILVNEELLAEPEVNPSFHSSNTLTEDSLSNLMGSRYCTMVGIIGPPDSGKTAALVSLYLMLSHGRLAGFEYADSKSLMALDEISRGARRWTDGTPPEQMTAHTELSSDRAAGFLHLKLRSTEDAGVVDFLLPDLPGEWSTAMVDQSRLDRLAFLQRADVIWLMVDGNRIISLPTRQTTIHRTKLYLQRLKEFLPKPPRVVLVMTRADVGLADEMTVRIIAREAEALGIEFAARSISSFSSNPDVQAGTGIPELIRVSVGREPAVEEIWPDYLTEYGSRAIWNTMHGGVDL